MHAMPKMSIHPCIPMTTDNVGNDFKQINDAIFRNTLHIVNPTVRICRRKKETNLFQLIQKKKMCLNKYNKKLRLNKYNKKLCLN